MARTYRRKNHPSTRHYLTDFVWAADNHGNLFLKDVPLKKGSVEYERKLAWLHGDSHPGQWSAPGWYRTVHNRAYRHGCNQVLRTLSDTDREVVLKPRAIQAAWLWF